MLQAIRKITNTLAVLTVIFLASFARAQCPGSQPAGTECVAASASKDITAHSVCKTVTNNHASGKAIMIPISTPTQWNAFYSRLPAGVAAADCGAVDFCSGKAIGEACIKTTALYAGTFDGGQYMIMPSGCANSTSNPSCSGTDTVQKTWNDGSNPNYDIPSISNVTSVATASSSSERGHVTTPIIAAITLAAQGGLHAAARYCDQMDYGGYTDWYLPSKSELSYIYCKSTPTAHSASYPNENINCGGTGPSNQLTGFAAGIYWTSTESTWAESAIQSFTSGRQYVSGTKNTAYYVRCIRRY